MGSSIKHQNNSETEGNARSSGYSIGRSGRVRPRGNKLRNVSFWSAYPYVLVFVSIYIEFGCQTAVYNQIPGYVRILLLLVASVPMVARFVTSKIQPRSLIVFLLMVLVVLLGVFLTADLINYLLLIIPIYIGFLVANTIDFEKFGTAFADVVCFLALYSIPCFALSVFAPSVIDVFPFLGYWHESVAQVHDLFFSVAITHSQYFRNCGIAWEPGAFAILLAIAMVFVVLFPDRHKRARLVVLAVAMITTFSTLGYFLLFAILFVISFGSMSLAQMRNGLAVFGIALVALAVFAPTEAGQLVFGKLSGLFSDSGDSVVETTQARLDAIYYPLQAFFSSPIFGVGYSEFYQMNVNLCHGVAVNTFLNWFALGGILLGGPCVVFYLRAIALLGKAMRLSLFSLAVLFLASILLASTESLLRISLIYVIVFYGCSITSKKRMLGSQAFRPSMKGGVQ